MDAPGHRAGTGKALLLHVHRNIERSFASPAEDGHERVLFNIKLGKGGGEIAHRDVGRAGDGGDVEFVGFADVQKQEI